MPQADIDKNRVGKGTSECYANCAREALQKRSHNSFERSARMTCTLFLSISSPWSESAKMLYLTGRAII